MPTDLSYFLTARYTEWEGKATLPQIYHLLFFFYTSLYTGKSLCKNISLLFFF